MVHKWMKVEKREGPMVCEWTKVQRREGPMG